MLLDKPHTYQIQRASRQRLLEFRKEILYKLKAAPCTDCHLAYHPYVMQWDHVRGKKYRNISEMLRRNSWQRILEEIEKCELVCANCHAKRTHNRLKGKHPLDKKDYTEYN